MAQDVLRSQPLPQLLVADRWAAASFRVAHGHLCHSITALQPTASASSLASEPGGHCLSFPNFQVCLHGHHQELVVSISGHFLLEFCPSPF